MRTIIALSIAALTTASAAAQQYPGGYPGGNAGGYPGLYGGGLSPYLNLRGGSGAGRLNNPAVNYYNFVRPYTGGTFGNAVTQPPMTGTPGRTTFFPNQVPVYADEEPLRQRVDDKAKPDENGLIPVDLPPAGHAAGFNNTMGYFGQSSASLGRPTPAPRRR